MIWAPITSPSSLLDSCTLAQQKHSVVHYVNYDLSFRLLTSDLKWQTSEGNSLQTGLRVYLDASLGRYSHLSSENKVGKISNSPGLEGVSETIKGQHQLIIS